MKNTIETVLFDLDGTLLDTAPDLAEALNATLQRNGRAAMAYEQIRPVVSHGGQALIQLGFDMQPEQPGFDTLRQQLLDHYQQHIADQTTLFPGMETVLHHLEDNDIAWGVVTNKPGWLTMPLLDALNLTERAASVVSGDTLQARKPDPAPLLHACRQIGSPADRCLYIGDARRDIEAGRNAGMSTLIAMFGYLTDTDQPETWEADALIHEPAEILQWLG